MGKLSSTNYFKGAGCECHCRSSYNEVELLKSYLRLAQTSGEYNAIRTPGSEWGHYSFVIELNRFKLQAVKRGHPKSIPTPL